MWGYNRSQVISREDYITALFSLPFFAFSLLHDFLYLVADDFGNSVAVVNLAFHHNDFVFLKYVWIFVNAIDKFDSMVYTYVGDKYDKTYRL